MQPNDLVLPRRKEVVGVLAWVAWGLGLAWAQTGPYSGDLHTFCFAVGWFCIPVWVALDERGRRGHWSLWTIFALLTGPVGFALYYLTRPPVPATCLRCGSVTPGAARACPACGNSPVLATVRSALAEVYTSLADSLVRGPKDRARDAAKHLAFAFAAVVVMGAILSPLFVPNPIRSLLALLYVVSIAAYWVLVAWWVYLDSAWRRMDGVPWAILTLVTNLVGLVTYLVIRYPDPRTCPRCGASVPTNLKYCPFCGGEAQTMCPRCQAPVKAEWQYCSACAAPLGNVMGARREASRATEQTRATPAQAACEVPASVVAEAEPEPQPGEPGIAIVGSVVDGVTGVPIEGARVAIDSATNGASAATDALGRFRIAVDSERPYVLVASADGYVAQPKPYAPGTEESRHIRFTLHQAS